MTGIPGMPRYAAAGCSIRPPARHRPAIRGGLRQAGDTVREGVRLVAANPLGPAVRRQLGIGRVLPLGGPADGSWITERAAAGALRAAVGAPAGLHLGSLRLTVADPGAAPAPVSRREP